MASRTRVSLRIIPKSGGLIFKKLASSYNKVILDMGAGVEKPVRILSSMAEKIIVLCTDEPTSLTDAYAFIKIMAMQYPKSDLNVVINQANSIREGQRTYDTLL